MLPVHNINYVIACLFDNKVEPRDYVHCISMWKNLLATASECLVSSCELIMKI